jgi:hypothetical protein
VTITTNKEWRMTAPSHTRWIAGVAAWTVASAVAHAWAGEQTGLPAEKTNHGIGYVSGGVGLDESAALKAAREDYSLDIETFQSAHGKNEYTSAVPLTVTKLSGEVVFEAPTEGPFTLLRLPPGRYIVHATYEGQTQHRQVEVGTGLGAKATFVFKPGS